MRGMEEYTAIAAALDARAGKMWRCRAKERIYAKERNVLSEVDCPQAYRSWSSHCRSSEKCSAICSILGLRRLGVQNKAGALGTTWVLRIGSGNPPLEARSAKPSGSWVPRPPAGGHLALA